MRRMLDATLLTGLLMFGSLALGACAGGEEGTAGEANQQEWAWLQQAKQELDAKRARLGELRTQLDEAPAEEDASAEPAAEPVPEEVEGEEPVPEEAAGPSLEEQVAQLEDEIANDAEEFSNRLVIHINSLEILEGEPLSPQAQQAFRMKSDEDIEVAKEWIEKGGDFRRAIDIYRTQLPLDPDYDRLQEALAWAEEMRYPNEERFEQVEKGMTRAQVREILGPVNLHNIREYPEQQAVAWFYNKDPEQGGGAAGVYFREDDKTARLIVYQTTFSVEAAESE